MMLRTSTSNMRFVLQWILFSCLLMFVFITPCSAAVSVSGAASFCGELVQNHSYLFNEPERTQLDEINRQLRRLVEQEKNADEANKSEWNAQVQDAVKQMLTCLESTKMVARFSIENGAIKKLDAEAVQLPGDEGAFLVRVDAGGDGERFVVHSQQYGEFPENRLWKFNIASQGVTWILISLFDVPADEITVSVQFERDGSPHLLSWIKLKTPPAGLLRFQVLGDDTGKPVPAMVRLVWMANGRDRRPSNGLEFAPQMDSQGSPSGRRMAQLPGGLEGPYWCVPGPFEMRLPPGEWQVMVRRGVEHVPVRNTFTIAPGKTVEKTYRPKRWVDMRKQGWYSGDEHVHGRMVSNLDAQRLQAWVQAEDIHIANIVKMGDVYRTWFEQRGWGKEYRIKVDDFILSPGQECPRTHEELGHTIHMNTTSMVRDTNKYFLYDWVFNQVDQQGGLSGFCHVLFEMFHVHRGMSLFVPDGSVDFIEIMQFNQMGTGLYYDFLNLGYKLTAAAGSDVPWGGTVGEVRMYAYLGQQQFSADAWFDAVKAGRTFVTNGPMIEFTVNGKRPGEEIIVKNSDEVKVEARVWGGKGRFTPTELEIVSQGEVIKRIEPVQKNQEEIHVKFSLPAKDGFWIAARAKGSDGSQAHTTPIYVKKNNLRFWNIDETERLLDERMESLQEVEDMLEEYKSRFERESGNFLLMQYVQQGPELMKRVERARKAYRDLRNKYNAERKERE
ncbi:MAG: CehA/McbA family metallohydrolase [Candidatus Hinthialibacter antarcticus]|nr:CehA/McbA family metallohydrolase [Candidatus Hinthialibacter antarcticus]